MITPAPNNTQAQRDADYILTKILRRTRYSSATRDDLAAALVKVANGETLAPKPKRKWNQYT